MKKYFALILTGIIILTVITFLLYNLFNDQTEFRHSCIAFACSIFCLVCYKDALKPSERGPAQPINMTKKHYERRGELHKYERLCKILFAITIAYGFLNLMFGLGEVLVIYLMSIYAN